MLGFETYNDFSSSHINKLYYNHTTCELIVEYSTGKQYKCSDVNVDEWELIKSAGSKGKYLTEVYRSRLKPFGIILG